MEIAILTLIAATVGMIDLLKNSELFREEEAEAPVPWVIDEGLLDGFDREMVLRSRDVLQAHLGKRPLDTLASLTVPDRVGAVEGLVRELVALYGISGELEEQHYDDFGSCEAGYYDYDRRIIWINVRYLRSNDRQALRNLLFTLFHELRHAVQKSVVLGNEGWEKDDAWRERMARSMCNYISNERDYEAYRNQLVEMDADTFGLQILKEVYDT